MLQEGISVNCQLPTSGQSRLHSEQVCMYVCMYVYPNGGPEFRQKN